ncbi:MAG: hypothetical protein ACYC1M_09275 [Armatimonadota bacterium]
MLSDMDTEIDALVKKRGKSMVLRTERSGPDAGSQFWGCTAYPSYKGTRPFGGSSPP